MSVQPTPLPSLVQSTNRPFGRRSSCESSHDRQSIGGEVCRARCPIDLWQVDAPFARCRSQIRLGGESWSSFHGTRSSAAPPPSLLLYPQRVISSLRGMLISSLPLFDKQCKQSRPLSAEFVTVISGLDGEEKSA